jgi:hypothetical protein
VDLIDIAFIYKNFSDEDPIVDWMKENGRLVLDKEGGRLDGHIA